MATMKRLSRTKRKRRRYRLLRQQKALAGRPIAGGWGQGAPVSRSDCSLVRQAIREGWHVSAEIRRLVVSDVIAFAETTNSTREFVAAADTIVAMAADNQRYGSTAHADDLPPNSQRDRTSAARSPKNPQKCRSYADPNGS